MLQHRQPEEIDSAEDALDAAEAYAAGTPDPHHRVALLSATRMLRRIDQAVVSFASDISGAGHATQPQRLRASA